ncbi:MAG: hypothetical protein QXO40_00070 [Candidatus Aenigmatarchaeota archaeon]
MPRKLFTLYFDEDIYNKIVEFADNYGISKAKAINVIFNFIFGRAGIKNVVNDKIYELCIKAIENYKRIKEE